MSIWVLYQKLTPEEENAIQERTHVTLPLEGLPDLSMVGTQEGFMHLLRVLHPDAPPETLSKMSDRTWKIYSELHEEDILMVPLPARQEVAVAEVTGKYEHRTGENREDIHLLPVKWHEQRIALRRFKKFPGLLNEWQRAYEVEDPQIRTMVRDKLPYGYSRFAKFKWLVFAFIAWRLFAHLSHLGSTDAPTSFP